MRTPVIELPVVGKCCDDMLECQPGITACMDGASAPLPAGQKTRLLPGKPLLVCDSTRLRRLLVRVGE